MAYVAAVLKVITSVVHLAETCEVSLKALHQEEGFSVVWSTERKPFSMLG